MYYGCPTRWYIFVRVYVYIQTLGVCVYLYVRTRMPTRVIHNATTTTTAWCRIYIQPVHMFGEQRACHSILDWFVCYSSVTSADPEMCACVLLAYCMPFNNISYIQQMKASRLHKRTHTPFTSLFLFGEQQWHQDTVYWPTKLKWNSKEIFQKIHQEACLAVCFLSHIDTHSLTLPPPSPYHYNSTQRKCGYWTFAEYIQLLVSLCIFPSEMGSNSHSAHFKRHTIVWASLFAFNIKYNVTLAFALIFIVSQALSDFRMWCRYLNHEHYHDSNNVHWVHSTWLYYEEPTENFKDMLIVHICSIGHWTFYLLDKFAHSSISAMKKFQSFSNFLLIQSSYLLAFKQKSPSVTRSFYICYYIT